MERRRGTIARRVRCCAVLLVVGVALTACGGGEAEPEDPGSSTAGGESTEVHVDPSEAASTAEVPVSVGELCAPYIEMVETLERIDYTQGEDEIALAIAPVMREWAAQIPDLERPPGLADRVWEGLLILGKRIERLPEEPTYAQLEAVANRLTDEQQKLVSAASEWFRTRCRSESE